MPDKSMIFNRYTWYFAIKCFPFPTYSPVLHSFFKNLDKKMGGGKVALKQVFIKLQVLNKTLKTRVKKGGK